MYFKTAYLTVIWDAATGLLFDSDYVDLKMEKNLRFKHIFYVGYKGHTPIFWLLRICIKIWLSCPSAYILTRQSWHFMKCLAFHKEYQLFHFSKKNHNHFRRTKIRQKLQRLKILSKFLPNFFGKFYSFKVVLIKSRTFLTFWRKVDGQ